MTILVHLFSVILVLIGLLFFFGSAVGLVRFPDFYTRMHAAGKGDTLSTILILLGAVLYVLTESSDADVLVAIKILAIAFFIMVTSPASTHALMQSGYDDGNEPFTRPESERTEEK